MCVYIYIYYVCMRVFEEDMFLRADDVFVGKTCSATVPAGSIFLCRGALPALRVSLTFFSGRMLVEPFLGEQLG